MTGQNQKILHEQTINEKSTKIHIKIFHMKTDRYFGMKNLDVYLLASTSMKLNIFLMSLKTLIFFN